MTNVEDMEAELAEWLQSEEGDECVAKILASLDKDELETIIERGVRKADERAAFIDSILDRKNDH